MKHIKLFEQFIAENKNDPFTAYIEDKRRPGGTDKDIMNDYGLQVKNRDRDGFDVVGYKADIEAFVADYSIILDEEPMLVETKTTINEAELRVGRDEPIARAIIAYFYAVEGTPEGDAIRAMRLNPVRSEINPKQAQAQGLGGWAKDGVKAMSGGMRVPSDVSISNAITLAADNGKSYYFDDTDFVEGDETIVRNTHKIGFREFVDALVKLGVIEAPKY